MLMLTVGAVGVGALLVRWVAMTEEPEDVVASDPTPAPASDVDDDVLAIVERELAEMDN